MRLAMNRRISVSNPAISSTPLLAQSYTPDGLIASLTDANSHTTSFTPDGFDGSRPPPIRIRAPRF
jgi:hypothetical protein